MAWFEISPGDRVRVDEEDAKRLREFHWFRAENGSITRAGGTYGARITLARTVMEVWDETKRVDRKEKIEDYRKSNLEMVENRAKIEGLPKNISRHKRKFRVSFKHGGKLFEKKGIATLGEAETLLAELRSEAFMEKGPAKRGGAREHGGPRTPAAKTRQAAKDKGLV